MSRQILYIEDNPYAQRLVKKVLSAHGYVVAIAENGVQGVEQARANPPHMILLDIQLPGLNALDVVRQLRQLDSCTAIPIVALTAHAEQYSRQQYLDAGCTDYLQKQAGIKPLLDLVKHCLEGGNDGG